MKFLKISKLILLTYFLAHCGGAWDLSRQSSLQKTIPQVIQSYPSANEKSVAVNVKPSLTFSQLMDASSIENSSFIVRNGNTRIEGSVITDAYSTSFIPKNNLPENALLTASVSNRVRSLVDGKSGANLQKDYVWSFTTGSESDTTRPVVSRIFPENGSTNVPINQQIEVVFSKMMDSSTISKLTFFLESGTSLVSGSVSSMSLVAIFSPQSTLKNNTLYTATVSVAAQDLAGNALDTNFTWSFTTGSSLDTTAPTVVNVLPSDSSHEVPINLKATAAFSEAIDPTTFHSRTFFMQDSQAQLVSGTISLIGNFASFHPTNVLASNKTYTLTMLSGVDGVKDLAGNALEIDYKWSFTTASSSQTSEPVTLISNPLNNAQNTCLRVPIYLSFNTAMDGATMTPSSFLLTGPGATAVAGSMSFNSALSLANFIPLNALAANTQYTVFVKGGSQGVHDLYGNAMLTNYQWVFTTGTQDCSQ